MGARTTKGGEDAKGPADEVGLILYPGVQLAGIYGLSDLLLTANRVMAQEAPSQPPIRISHWTLEKDILTRNFASFTEPPGRLFALVLAPTLGDPPSPTLAAPYLGWLQAQYRAGVILTSVCAGTFLLAETGLLDGRAATTHWMHADAFRQRFPQIRLEVERMLADEGDVITAGGLMAWTDLGLRLVERLRGTAIMISTARAMLIDPPGREQRFYSKFMPQLAHGDKAILHAQLALRQDHGKEISLPALANAAGLEQRTFLRRFRAATGFTATQYAQRLRIARAQELLQQRDGSVDQIAWEVGYADPASFRKIFTRITGLSPSAYRRRLSGRSEASGRA